MFNKLNILYLLVILFHFVHLRQKAYSVDINNKKDFTFDSSELYVYSQATKDGALVFIITLNNQLDKYSEKILYAAVDDAQSIDQIEKFEKNSALYEKKSGDKYQYYHGIYLKEKQYGITKITGLSKGDTVNVEVKYESKTVLIIILVVLGFVICCVLIIVIRCIRKMCC